MLTLFDTPVSEKETWIYWCVCVRERGRKRSNKQQITKESNQVMDSVKDSSNTRQCI